MTDEIRASRRIVFQGLGALGVAAILAGCGGGDDEEGAPAEEGTSRGSSPSADDPTSAGGASGGLASTNEIPVGGGIILADENIVITQPTAGEFKAFSSTCTHEGNTVTSVGGGAIQCAFHGSSFDAATGENVGGPAPSPLREVAIRVKGDTVVKA